MTTYHRDPFNRPLKKLELSVRRLFNRLFLADRTPTVVTSTRDAIAFPDRPSFVFLRQDRIGDVLITSPIIRAVREKYPDARIDVVLSRNNVMVANTLELFINGSYVYQRSTSSLLAIIRAIRKQRYDVIVDLLDNASSTSSLLVSMSNTRFAVGIDKENRGVYTHVVPLLDKATTHISERIRSLVMALGIEPASVDMRPMYPISEADASRAKALLFPDGRPQHPIGVVFSGSSVLRTYPEEKVIAVLNQIKPLYPSATFFVFCAPHHREQAARIAAAVGAQAVPATPSFHAYAAALHEMDALITPDTSAVHLAAAWDMPSCVLFNQHDPNLYPWYPYQTHCEAVINHGNDLADIAIDDVVRAIERLFAYCTIPKEHHGLS